MLDADKLPREAPVSRKWRDGCNDHDKAGFQQDLCHFRDSSNVLGAIFVAVAKVSAQTKAEIVAVQEKRMFLLFEKR